MNSVLRVEAALWSRPSPIDGSRIGIAAATRLRRRALIRSGGAVPRAVTTSEDRRSDSMQLAPPALYLRRGEAGGVLPIREGHDTAASPSTGEQRECVDSPSPVPPSPTHFGATWHDGQEPRDGSLIDIETREWPPAAWTGRFCKTACSSPCVAWTRHGDLNHLAGPQSNELRAEWQLYTWDVCHMDHQVTWVRRIHAWDNLTTTNFGEC